MNRLREAIRSVPNRELPNLSQHIVRASGAFAAVAAVASIFFAVLAYFLSRDLSSSLFIGVTYVGGFGGAAWLSTRAVSARYAEALAFVVAVLFVLAATFAGVLAETDALPTTAYTVVTPLVLCSIIPWKPGWSLTLGLVSMVLPLALVPDAIGVPVPVFVFMGVLYAMFAAVGNQLQRRLWQRLERAKQQLVAGDRLSSLGSMVAGIAHELKTPSAAASSSLFQMRTLSSELRESIGNPEVTDADFREIVAELDAAMATCTRSVERGAKFIQAIRSGTMGMHASSDGDLVLRERVETVLSLLEHRARKGRVELLVEVGDVVVRGDPGKFDQVATNLIGNAIDACSVLGRDSKVVVSAQARTGGVLFAVQDDGPGVDPAVGSQIFDAMFTTRQSEGGTGLGLSISRDIMEGAFGGTLRLGASDRGARFEAWFPDGGAKTVDTAPWAPAQRPASD